MADEAQELEVDYANKRLKLRGNDLIQTVTAIIVIAMMAVFGYILYEHMQDSAKRDDRFITAIVTQTATAERSGATLREMVCLLSLPQDQRSSELSGVSTLCKRLAALP